MKVNLTGINPQIYNNPCNDFYIKQLLKHTYPIEVISYKGSIFFDDVQEVELVLLNNQEVEIVLLNNQEVEIVLLNNEEWSLEWFTYEEIKD